MDDLWASLLK
ncbi:unnamed protein product, partial [Adineta steineri]